MKLGPGGLVRAYGTAVKDAIVKSEFSEIKNGRKLVINLDYTILGTIQHKMLEVEAEELESTYDDGVSLTMVLPSENYERFRKELTQIFAGKERVEELGEVRYGKGSEGIFLL